MSFHYYSLKTALSVSLRNELYPFKWRRHRRQIEHRNRLVSQRNRITTQRPHTAVYSRHLKRPIMEIVVNASFLNQSNAWYTKSNQQKRIHNLLSASGNNNQQTLFTNNPNQFVDQGYTDWNAQPAYQAQANRVVSPPTYSNGHSDGSRIVPIQLEDGHPYLNGPVSQTPPILQK